LSVDAAIAHEDLESSLVSPGFVPRVDAEPVVFAVLGTPTDGLSGVTSEGSSRDVLIDTALVCQEIFVDSEGVGDGTIGHDISLDVVNSLETVAGGGEVLVASIVDSGVAWAGREALGSVGRNIIA